MSDEDWTEDLSKNSDEDEDASEWAPVIMTGIIAVTVILICLICGDTVTTAVTAIWGKS